MQEGIHEGFINLFPLGRYEMELEFIKKVQECNKTAGEKKCDKSKLCGPPIQQWEFQ